jgi:hypothetical protein
MDAISSEREEKLCTEEEVERSDELNIDWKLIIACGGLRDTVVARRKV